MDTWHRFCWKLPGGSGNCSKVFVSNRDIQRTRCFLEIRRKKLNENGIMERWNSGIMCTEDPTLHFSNIPMTHIIKEYNQYGSKDLSP